MKRLDQLRPSEVSPASFLFMLNGKIKDLQNDEAFEFVTPEEFVHEVAQALPNSELTDEVLDSISRRVEGVLDEKFPPLADILTHITNIISQKFDA